MLVDLPQITTVKLIHKPPQKIAFKGVINKVYLPVELGQFEIFFRFNDEYLKLVDGNEIVSFGLSENGELDLREKIDHPYFTAIKLASENFQDFRQGINTDRILPKVGDFYIRFKNLPVENGNFNLLYKISINL